MAVKIEFFQKTIDMHVFKMFSFIYMLLYSIFYLYNKFVKTPYNLTGVKNDVNMSSSPLHHPCTLQKPPKHVIKRMYVKTKMTYKPYNKHKTQKCQIHPQNTIQNNKKLLTIITSFAILRVDKKAGSSPISTETIRQGQHQRRTMTGDN